MTNEGHEMVPPPARAARNALDVDIEKGMFHPRNPEVPRPSSPPSPPKASASSSRSASKSATKSTAKSTAKGKGKQRK